MSIDVIDINEYPQVILRDKEAKEQFGEVNTPFELIDEMLLMIPEKYYKDPNLKWLDPCCGSGYFVMKLFLRLMEGLKDAIFSPDERKEHIIKNMIYMYEINGVHIPTLKKLFGKDVNLYHQSFFDMHNTEQIEFDIIIGNPPYNMNGTVKVPTNHVLIKKLDGKTIWMDFIRRAISTLKKDGLLLMITPTLWLRPDRAKMHDFMFKHDILEIRCMTNTETMKRFHYHIQTPTCYFLLQNRCPNIENNNGFDYITLYDRYTHKFIYYNLHYLTVIPVFGSDLIKSITPFLLFYGSIPAYKTNMPQKEIQIIPIEERTKENEFLYPYENISTCLLSTLTPYLKKTASSMPLVYHGTPKIVLAHKMYGFPYYDSDGKYGLSTRDNYVIKGYSDDMFRQLLIFLSSKMVRYIFESTRYRMKYLEKEAFWFIPDITKMPEFPILDENADVAENQINTFFMLSPANINAISTFSRKDFKRTVDEL